MSTHATAAGSSEEKTKNVSETERLVSAAAGALLVKVGLHRGLLSLTGLATVRAYGESERFIKRNEELIDTENRAYYLTVVNQRWLGMRLDLCGALLVLTVAIVRESFRASDTRRYRSPKPRTSTRRRSDSSSRTSSVFRTPSVGS